jgi:hypothetical protein
MAQHPRCWDYRKALGLKEYSRRICMEHHKFLPRQRLDLETETLLPSRPHWTEEEMHAWFDDEDRREDEIVAIGVAKLKAGGRFSAEKPKELWARWAQEHVSEKEKELELYRFRE